MSKRIDELPDVGSNSSLAHFFAAQASGGGAGTTYRYDGDDMGGLLSGNLAFMRSWISNTPFAGFGLSPTAYDYYWWQANGGGTPTTNLAVLATGTVGDGTSLVYGVRNTYTQASAAGSAAVAKSRYFTNLTWYRGNASGINGFLVFDFFSVDGTNWNNTGASTGSRFYSGFMNNSNTATIGGTDNPSVQRAAFMRAHVDGGLTESNWYFSTRDATTENRVDTLVPFGDNGDQYCAMIACAPQGSTIYYAIKNLTDNVDSGVLNTSSNLPQSTTGLLHMTGFYNVDAVSRVMGWKKCNIYQRNLI